MMSRRLSTAGEKCPFFKVSKRLAEGKKWPGKEQKHKKQPAAHDIAVSCRCKITGYEILGKSGTQHATQCEDERGVDIGILTDESETTLTVGMRRHQTKLKRCQVVQQLCPHKKPP